MGKQWKQRKTLFWGALKSLQMVTAAMKLKDAAPGKKNYDQRRHHIKKRRQTKVRLVKAMVFPVVYVWMWVWELDSKESWEPKNWCFWTVVLEKTLESPLDCKEIQPVHPKGNQSCSLEGLMLKLKLPIFWPPDAKNWLIWKDPGKDWR